MLKLKLLILWSPDVKNWFIGKDPDARKDWRQEEKGMTKDEMVGWHHWLDGHEFEQAPGVGDGQGGLACCSPWGCRVRHDWVTELNWTKPGHLSICWHASLPCGPQLPQGRSSAAVACTAAAPMADIAVLSTCHKHQQGPALRAPKQHTPPKSPLPKPQQQNYTQGPTIDLTSTRREGLKRLKVLFKPVNPKGNQSWIFIGRTVAKAEAPILCPPDVKSWLTGKDPNAGEDRRQEEKEATENEMVRQHHWLNRHESEQTPGDSEGQGSLACCSSWGCKEFEPTEWLNNNNKSRPLGQSGGARTQHGQSASRSEHSATMCILLHHSTTASQTLPLSQRNAGWISRDTIKSLNKNTNISLFL